MINCSYTITMEKGNIKAVDFYNNPNNLFFYRVPSKQERFLHLPQLSKSYYPLSTSNLLLHRASKHPLSKTIRQDRRKIEFPPLIQSFPISPVRIFSGKQNASIHSNRCKNTIANEILRCCYL